MFTSLLVFLPRLSLLFHLFLQQVSQSHSQGWNICLLLILPLSLFFFSPSTPPPPAPLSRLWWMGCVAVYLLYPQGEAQLTLYANIRSAIISNLFHTHFGFHSV